MITASTLSYSDGIDTFLGKLVWQDDGMAAKPGILIAPTFGGLGAFEEDRAHALAAQGYVVLALDYYGNGKQAESPAEAMALMGQLNANRPVLARRMLAALNALSACDSVDPARIGAMGYCFGGKAVLDLARSGAAFQAMVSVHGVYDPPEFGTPRIAPAALILHGWDDPLGTPTDLMALTAELTRTCHDWQVLAFGHTGHAFTDPQAQSPAQGMAFNAAATRRSWQAILQFFEDSLQTAGQSV